MIMSLTEFERETIINMNDGEDIAYIYSAQRKIITKLRNNPAAVLVEEGVHDGSAWARFTLPAAYISFRSATVRRELTSEQRQALADAMRERQTARKPEMAATA
jgi:hypothetical protein